MSTTITAVRAVSFFAIAKDEFVIPQVNQLRLCSDFFGSLQCDAHGLARIAALPQAATDSGNAYRLR
jgi:hypothetical protein